MPVLATLMGENSPATSFSVGKPEARVVNWGWPRVAQRSAAGARRQAVVTAAPVQCSPCSPAWRPQGHCGDPRRGPYSPAWAAPASFPPAGRQVPFSCGKKADRLSPGAAGSCPLSCGSASHRLDNPGCVLGIGSQRKHLGSGPGAVGGVGPVRLEVGPPESPLLQRLFSLTAWQIGTGTAGGGGSPAPSESDASRRLHGGQCPACPAVLSLWRPHPQGT